VESFLALVASQDAASGSTGAAFHAAALARGIPGTTAVHLLDLFADSAAAGLGGANAAGVPTPAAIGGAAWAAAIARPSVPLALRLLAALVLGHQVNPLHPPGWRN
jgi:hypothetical protein